MLPTKALCQVRVRERDTLNIGAKSSLLGVAVLQQHSGVLADNDISVFFLIFFFTFNIGEKSSLLGVAVLHSGVLAAAPLASVFVLL